MTATCQRIVLARRPKGAVTPENFRLERVPMPQPGPGEVLVELRAASLNHLDLWVRKGLPSVPKPRILGAGGAPPEVRWRCCARRRR